MAKVVRNDLLGRRAQRATGAAEGPAVPFGERLPAAGTTFTLRSGAMSLPFSAGDAACIVRVLRGGDRRTGRVSLSFFTPARGFVTVIACARFPGGDLHQRGPHTRVTLDASRREPFVVCDTTEWFDGAAEGQTTLLRCEWRPPS